MTDKDNTQDVQGVVERLRDFPEVVEYQDSVNLLEQAATLLLSEHEGRVRAEASLQALRDALLPPGPMCRDCGDEDGRCPGLNRPCDTQEAALERVASLSSSQARVEELERALERISDAAQQGRDCGGLTETTDAFDKIIHLSGRGS